VTNALRPLLTAAVLSTLALPTLAGRGAEDAISHDLSTSNGALAGHEPAGKDRGFSLLLVYDAEAGDAEAQFELAWAYDKGIGTTEDDALAAEWYAKSADQGYVYAQFAIGWMYEITKDDRVAFDWYMRAAQSGDREAKYALGLRYDEGIGVAEDNAEAVRWYTEAAEAGMKQAQNNLGVMYATGEGVALDEAEALRWYTAAAEQGESEAQDNLARAYDKGKGTEADKAAL